MVSLLFNQHESSPLYNPSLHMPRISPQSSPISYHPTSIKPAASATHLGIHQHNQHHPGRDPPADLQVSPSPRTGGAAGPGGTKQGVPTILLLPWLVWSVDHLVDHLAWKIIGGSPGVRSGASSETWIQDLFGVPNAVVNQSLPREQASVGGKL